MKQDADQKTKKQKSAIRKNLDLLIIFSIFIPVYYAHALTQPISPFMPREEPYEPYQRHTLFSLSPPFVFSYFLMKPKDYQPEKYTYPLVVLLHGASAHMYGGKVLKNPMMREHFKAFVLIPIAPFGFLWDVPQNSFKPKAYPLVMSAIKEVQSQNNIDPNKIYVTGYSMGGLGTYGMISRYHDVFAAAAPTDATWDPSKIDAMDEIPIWIFHGRKDKTVHVNGGRSMALALKKAGRDVQYTEYPNRGHGAWVPAYENPKFWMWLFSQRKKKIDQTTNQDKQNKN